MTLVRPKQGNSGAGAGSMAIAWGEENVNAIKKLNGLTFSLKG